MLGSHDRTFSVVTASRTDDTYFSCQTWRRASLEVAAASQWRAVGTLVEKRDTWDDLWGQAQY